MEEKEELKQKEGGRVETNENPAPKNTEKKDAWKGILFILLSAFCFALMSLFVRLSGDLPTFQKAFFRNLVAAIVSLSLLIKSGSLKMQKGSFPALLLRSVAGTVGIVCNFYAIDNMAVADASILNKLSPFFSVIFSVWLLKEKASWKDWLLVAVAFTGALFVVKPTFRFQRVAPALIGALGGLGAGLAYTCVRYLRQRGERAAFIVFFFSAFSSLVVLPFMLASYQPMEWWQVACLLLAGGAASGAQFAITAAYTYAPAKEISVYDYSQVLFTALLGICVLGEFPDYISVIGYAIIIGAAVVKWLLGRKDSRT